MFSKYLPVLLSVIIQEVLASGTHDHGNHTGRGSHGPESFFFFSEFKQGNPKGVALPITEPTHPAHLPLSTR